MRGDRSCSARQGWAHSRGTDRLPDLQGTADPLGQLILRQGLSAGCILTCLRELGRLSIFARTEYQSLRD